MKKLLYLFLLLSTISQIETGPKKGRRGTKRATRRGRNNKSRRGGGSTRSRSSIINPASSMLRPTSTINATTTPTGQESDNPFSDMDDELFKNTQESKEQKERTGDALQYYTEIETDIGIYENYCKKIKKEIEELSHLINNYNKLKQFASNKELIQEFDTYLENNINTQNLISLQNKIKSIEKLLKEKKNSLEKTFDAKILKTYKKQTASLIKKNISKLQASLEKVFYQNEYKTTLEILGKNKNTISKSEKSEQKINSTIFEIIQKIKNLIIIIKLDENDEKDKLNKEKDKLNKEKDKLNKKKNELSNNHRYAKDDFNLTEKKKSSELTKKTRANKEESNVAAVKNFGKEKDSRALPDIRNHTHTELFGKIWNRLEYIIKNNIQIANIKGTSYYQITENNKKIKVNIEALYQETLEAIYMPMINFDPKTLNDYINTLKEAFIQLGSSEIKYENTPIAKAIEKIKNMAEQKEERSKVRKYIKETAARYKNRSVQEFFGINEEEKSDLVPLFDEPEANKKEVPSKAKETFGEYDNRKIKKNIQKKNKKKENKNSLEVIKEEEEEKSDLVPLFD